MLKDGVGPLLAQETMLRAWARQHQPLDPCRGCRVRLNLPHTSSWNWKQHGGPGHLTQESPHPECEAQPMAAQWTSGTWPQQPMLKSQARKALRMFGGALGQGLGVAACLYWSCCRLKSMRRKGQCGLLCGEPTSHPHLKGAQMERSAISTGGELRRARCYLGSASCFENEESVPKLIRLFPLTHSHHKNVSSHHDWTPFENDLT